VIRFPDTGDEIASPLPLADAGNGRGKKHQTFPETV
jgi:hypothetical protein